MEDQINLKIAVSHKTGAVYAVDSATDTINHLERLLHVDFGQYKKYANNNFFTLYIIKKSAHSLKH